MAESSPDPDPRDPPRVTRNSTEKGECTKGGVAGGSVLVCGGGGWPPGVCPMTSRVKHYWTSAIFLRAECVSLCVVEHSAWDEPAAAAAKVEADEAEWRENVGPVTEDDFLVFAQGVVSPGYDYYRKLYLTPLGAMYNLRLAFRGATVLDQFNIAAITIPAAELLVDDLKHFGFPEFTPDFLQDVKKELSLLKQHAQRDFDRDAVDKLSAKLKKEEARATEAATVTPMDLGVVMNEIVASV